MENEIIGKEGSAVVTNVQKGTTKTVDFFLFMPYYKITMIVKVERVVVYTYRGNGGRDIKIQCLALDSGGFVFKVELIQYFKYDEEDRGLIERIQIGECYFVVGPYSINSRNIPEHMLLYSPSIEPLPEKYKREYVEKAFEINGRKNDDLDDLL